MKVFITVICSGLSCHNLTLLIFHNFDKRCVVSSSEGIIWNYEYLFKSFFNVESTEEVHNFTKIKVRQGLHTKINAIGPCLGIQTASLLANTFLIPVQNGSTFVYSEKATKFCKISSLLLSTVHTDKIRWRFRKLLWPSQNIWTYHMS